VPYPFGIGDGCSLPLPGFNLTCDQAPQHSPRLLLGDGGTLQVVEISLANSTVRAIDTAGAVNITYHGEPEGNGTWSGLGSGSGDTYVLSEERNQFVVTGCNVQGTLLGDSRNVIIGCSSFCSIKDIWINPVVNTSGGDGTVACSGVGCCQTPIPIGRPNYTVEFKYLDLEYMGKLPTALRIAERGWFDGVAAQMLNESTTDAQVQQVPAPVVLEWVVASTPVAPPGSTAAEDTGNWSCPVDAARSACRSSHSTCHNVTGNYRNGYVCRCQDGYDGNPYLAGDGGCQGMHGHHCAACSSTYMLTLT
jgi:hypothetical protein